MMRRLAFVLAVVAWLVAACGGTGSTRSATPATSASTAAPAVSPAQTSSASGLTVFAAASLKDAFTRLQAEWARDHPKVPLTFSFDASSALEAQIEQGAPADVFASADSKLPTLVLTQGYGVGSVTPFAGNILTVIVPAANPAGLRSPADLARPGVRVVAAGDSVPVSIYANRALQRLAELELPGYPKTFAADVAANIVSKEDNVRAVLAKIELGEGDAAIVYVTDAKTSTKVVTIPIPDAANVPATYAAVAIKGSTDATVAAAFVTWLASPAAQGVLATFGFLPPPK